jgi:hypothetical protein
MIREPIGRLVSEIFFWAVRRGAPEVLANLRDRPFVDSISEIMWFREGPSSHKQSNPLVWLDRELRGVFGIDVYTHPFDKGKGYTIIKQGNIELLLMKLEKLNTLESVVAGFVGAPRFKLCNVNEAKNEPYKYIYEQVKRTIDIPHEHLEYYYEDPRLRHFYSDEEIDAFKRKWERNRIEDRQ